MYKMAPYLYILLTTAIIISVEEDLRRQKIPNLVTYLTMVMAICLHALSTGLSGLLFSLSGLALGMAMFILPYIMGGMGAGDVKLMMAIGAILGPKGIVAASILAILWGGVYGLILFGLNPHYAISYLRRTWLTIKTFMLTFQLVLFPPDTGEKRPVLKYAIPIALGTCAYIAMQITGYDFLLKWLGIDFTMYTISQGGL